MKAYDSSEVTVTVGPIEVNSGREKGTFVRIENESDDYGDEVGADEEVVRWKTNDQRATITLILMASSSSNQAFSALRTADFLAPNGAGIVPLYIKDNNGASIYAAKDCWIQKPPTVEYGQEPGTREWVFRVAKLKRNDAGI